MRTQAVIQVYIQTNKHSHKQIHTHTQTNTHTNKPTNLETRDPVRSREICYFNCQHEAVVEVRVEFVTLLTSVLGG